MMEILRAEHLTKIYGKGETAVRALDDVSFKVEAGEFIAVVGSSGSGKSTLIHILGSVDTPTSGKVFMNGQNVFAIASSDAHQLSVIDTGLSLLLMEEQTSAAARKALENGEFFAASHCLGNPDELADIAAALKEYYGETDLYQKVDGTVKAMAEKRCSRISHSLRSKRVRLSPLELMSMPMQDLFSAISPAYLLI